MGVGEDFQTFCSRLTISNRDDIGKRYQLITKRLNADFRNLDSYTAHSFYTGSYGRGTAIGFVSDADMIYELPDSYYIQYSKYITNGQSALLQAVSRSIQKTYSSTNTVGDGQVVVVSFTDGVKFEVVPAFKNADGSYKYPDSNNGGSWKITNPKPEIGAMAVRDLACNNNLKPLCRMARAWERAWGVPAGGLLIDTLAYQFIENWEHRKQSYAYYDFMSRDFFEYIANQDKDQEYWRAPGSGQYVWGKGLFQYKARQCYNLAVDATNYGLTDKNYSARQKWREIYGPAYPDK
jgi:hypothetical protein